MSSSIVVRGNLVHFSFQLTVEENHLGKIRQRDACYVSFSSEHSSSLNKLSRHVRKKSHENYLLIILKRFVRLIKENSKQDLEE